MPLWSLAIVASAIGGALGFVYEYRGEKKKRGAWQALLATDARDAVGSFGHTTTASLPWPSGSASA